jgi:hypothetical protein
VLLENDGPARAALHDELASLAETGAAGDVAVDAVRRALVETLRHGDRTQLVRELDAELLGTASRVRVAN